MIHTLSYVLIIALAAGTAWGMRDLIRLDRNDYTRGASDAAAALVALIGIHMLGSYLIGMVASTTIVVLALIAMTRPWTLLTPKVSDTFHAPETENHANVATETVKEKAHVAAQSQHPARVSKAPAMGMMPHAGSEAATPTPGMSEAERDAFAEIAKQFHADDK